MAELPKGAMPPPVPSLSFQPASPPRSPRLDSAPATPSPRPLEDDSQAQYATYRDDDDLKKPNGQALGTGNGMDEEGTKAWIPFPLRKWFWIPYVTLLVGIAIALEVALHFSKKKQGWPTKGDFTNTAGVLHYVYTLPPVAVVAIIVAIWTWTDIEIKKMQPYIDLVHGDSPPHRSLLLDYTRHNNFYVWTRAATNKHYLVALTSLMVLICLTFQPLAAALLAVRNIWSPLPDVTVNNLGSIGLNESPQFQDLTVFVNAAGFASASVLYDLPEPPFTFNQYSIAPFSLPTDSVPVNGTIVTVNTTAVKSDPGCRPVQVQAVQLADTNWNNSATLGNCSLTWHVDHSATSLFGTNALKCDPAPDPQFAPVVFWFFTYKPSVKSSATFCFPSISLWEVSASVNLANGLVTQVKELRPFTSSSNFSSLSGNITGPPLNGQALNGIQFDLNNPDPFTLARQNATQLQMPAAVFQSAIQSSAGLVGSFDSDRFVGLSTGVYQTYLTLIAQSVYFLPSNDPNTAHVMTTTQRVFLSDVSVHLLAVGFLILAFFSTIIQLMHQYDRRKLRLLHEPGTIASAVSIGGQTGIGELLAGRQNQNDIRAALQDKKFRIDPSTMRIIMEGEPGYEFAASPVDRRKSVFGVLQANRMSKRFSRAPPTPTTPTTPKAE